MTPVLNVLGTIFLLHIFWVFAGYQISLLLFKKKHDEIHESNLIGISIIIPTYNEASVIEKKIKNLEELDYPRDLLEIIIVDSASVDGTVEKIHPMTIPLRIIRESQKLGKAHAINTALPQASHELILITDANAFMEPSALRNSVKFMSDRRIGGVAGAMRQIDRSSNSISEGGDMYWKMEVFMRTRESNLASVISMSGEFSLLRKNIFLSSDGSVVVPWYHRGRTDDLEMTLWIIRRGFKVTYAPQAIVWEQAPDNMSDLYKQKVRIIVQTMHTVFSNWSTIFTTGIFGSYIFLSRKILPLFIPFSLVGLFVISIVLTADSKVWPAVLFLQCTCYLLAFIGIYQKKGFVLTKLAAFFVLLNGTVVVAWWEFLRKKDYTSWMPIQGSRKI